MNLQDIIEMFPSDDNVVALTGYIPLTWIDNHKKEIKKIVSENKLRRIYRGPRGTEDSFTLKENAHSLVLYKKHYYPDYGIESNTKTPKTQINVELGQYIKAIDVSYYSLNQDWESLTVDKLYEIVYIDTKNSTFDVVDDDGNRHTFDVYEDGSLECFEHIDKTFDLVDETIEKMVEKYRQDLYTLLKINKG